MELQERIVDGRRVYISTLTERCILLYDRDGTYIGQCRGWGAVRAVVRRLNEADSALAREAAQEARDRRAVGYPF